MIPFIEEENKFHFLGSIVYIDTLHKGSFNEWTIIDGQQRLTTIFILLQVLKEIFPEYNKVISKKYLENDEDIINSTIEFERYRLKPLVSDDDVYLKIAKNELDKLTEEEKKSNIFKAYNTIKATMQNWKSKYTIDIILSALDKFKIVWIQLSKYEEPQQVFESINSTGKGLTAADLIRNFVLMNKNDEEQTYIYNNYWRKIEFDYVGTNKLKEFFRYYISIKEKTTIPEKEVYDRFKKEYIRLQEDSEEESILKNILDYAKYYYYINNNIEDKEIEMVLKDYRNTKSTMPHIILLETFKLYFENTISKNDVTQTIQLLTTYIIRRNIAGLDTKSISNALPLEIKLGDEVYSDFSYWSEVYIYVLKNLFNINQDSFLNAYSRILEKYDYKNVQITDNIEDIKYPVEFEEGWYCDTANNTPHKLSMLKRIIEEMKLDIICDITYMKNEDKI